MPIFVFFRKSLIVPKRVYTRNTTFSQAEISHESEGVPFDEKEKISEKKVQSRKKVERKCIFHCP